MPDDEGLFDHAFSAQSGRPALVSAGQLRDPLGSPFPLQQVLVAGNGLTMMTGRKLRLRLLRQGFEGKSI
ncbi:MAG: hypothetical protein ACREX9_15900 [Gammaproteobacteria bacterium]